MDALVVTWQGGGATQPAFGLGRTLATRGHRVRILAPKAYEGRAAAAGCEHRPLPAAAEFDPALGRSADDQEDYIEEILFGASIPAALLAEQRAESADAIVVDYLLRSTLCAAESLGMPWFMLVHMTHRFYGRPRGGDEPWGWRWQYDRINQIRADLGLEALPVGPDPWSIAMMRRSQGALVEMPREFDDWPREPPASVHHLGPIFEGGGAIEWQPPWSVDDNRPLVLVSLGMTYMHQEHLLERIASALAGLEVRVLVLTGSELAPEDLELPGTVWVRSYVPHSAVLPEADLLVTHGGVGTLMAAFAAGVPMLCLPLGRDQNENAGRAAELDTARVLGADSSAEEVANAARAALTSASLHQGAEQMAAVMAGYDGARAAAETIERAVGA